MPKSIHIDPSETRTRGTLEAARIQIYSYDKSLLDEQEARGRDALIEAYRQMLILRAF